MQGTSLARIETVCVPITRLFDDQIEMTPVFMSIVNSVELNATDAEANTTLLMEYCRAPQKSKPFPYAALIESKKGYIGC
jgi:hypothetical protein